LKISSERIGGGGTMTKNLDTNEKYKIFFINYFSVQPRIKNENLQF
jgi:hypothetical protein